jgi:ABC-2 type transport system ATP-binding protein
MSAAIMTEGLTRRYGARLAVDALSLEVERGEVFGLLGPNGAGKTTTIAMLLGLVRPSAGRALVLGHDVWQAPQAALARVGAMIEAPAFYPYLSGRANLRVLAQAGGIAAERIATVLATVDLTARADDRVATYSQGMKQRLAIAAALLPDPELVILDEPTNGLDPAGTVEVRHLIRNLAADGRTILLCSHILHEVEQLCRRVAILKAGKLIRAGAVHELLRRNAGLRIRVTTDPAAAAALLIDLPGVTGVQRTDDMLLVEAPTTQAVMINRHLVAHDVGVAELGVQQHDLERFFLDVTGSADHV